MSNIKELLAYFKDAPADRTENAEQILSAVRAICANNLFLFATEVLGYSDLCPDLHGDITNLLQDFSLEKLVVLVPRGMFKSSLITISYVMWRLCKDPDRTFLIYSYRASKADEFLEEIAQHFTSNPILRALYSHIIPDNDDINRGYYSVGQFKKKLTWNSKELTIKRNFVSRTPSISVAGEKTALASTHMHEIIVDDSVTDGNYSTLSARDQTDIKVKSLWPLLKQNESSMRRMIFAGTRWIRDDQYERMHKIDFGGPIELGLHGDDKCKYYCRRAIENGKSIHADFSLEQLHHDKQYKAGEYLFNACYMNDPQDPSDKIFQIANINYYKKMPDIVLANGSVVPRKMNKFILHDPATGLSNCDSVVMGVGITDTSDVYILDLFASRFNMHESIMQMIELYKLYDRDLRKIAIEGFGYQKVIGGELEQCLKDEGLSTGVIENVGSVKASKESRIMGLQTIVNCHRLFVCQSKHKKIVDQLEEFPGSGLVDVIDTLSFIRFDNVWKVPSADYDEFDEVSDDPYILSNIYKRSGNLNLSEIRLSDEIPESSDIFNRDYAMPTRAAFNR